MPTDEYDEAVAYLTNRPDYIQEAWARPGHHESGCLFQFCSLDGQLDTGTDRCGCLTQVKHQGREVTGRHDLTAQIRGDERIPKSYDIRPENLPVFAEWQRRLDREIRGEVVHAT